MDLSKLSDADLQAMQSGDMSKVSDDGLRVLSGEPPGLARSFINGIPKGFAGLVDSFNNAPENLMNLSRMISGSIATAAGHPEYAVDVKPPTNAAHDILTKVGAIRPAAEPTTAGGRIVDMMGQSIGGGGINPSAIARNASRGAIVPIVRDVTAALASGAGAGAGLEAARQVDTGSESGNAALQTAASIAAGAVPGAFLAARGSAGDRTAAALNGVSKEQLAMADALLKRAAAAGTPLTGYEAIQAITGLNPKMQTQQRVTEQSDAAARNLTPMMQARAGRNTTAAGRAFGEIAPVDPAPDALAGLLQQGATDAIRTAHQARSAEAGPFYKAQRASDAEAIGLGEQIPMLADKLRGREQARDQVVQLGGKNLAYANEMDAAASQWSPVPGYPTFPRRYAPQNDRMNEAIAAVPEFEAARLARVAEIEAAQAALNKSQDALAAKNLPEIRTKVTGYLADLDRRIKLAGPTQEGKILQDLRDQIAPGGEPILLPSQLESVYKANRNKTELSAIPTSDEKTVAGVIGPYVTGLDKVIKDISPDIAAGRAKYAELSRDYVTPMEKGQIGKLTRSDEFPVQAGVLLPEKPWDVTPDVVSKTVRTIDAEAPGVPARFIRQYLEGTFNESNGGGIANNPKGGYQFAKKVADNPMQRENLIAALRASGKSPTPLIDLLDTFHAQGMKPEVNSATAANMAESSMLGGRKAVDFLMRPIRAIPGQADAWRNSLATKELADALASPDSVQRLQEIARANGTYSPMKQQMLVNLLMGQRAAQDANKPRVDVDLDLMNTEGR
ncbi:hypothetical protein WIX39_026135 [Variovorax sp. AB1(2024)]|uniref:hypothetical protein n=1 Tax=Variovorax sp. AB1(2024) TaxID=3132214 RepID=UPI003094F4D8